MGEWGKWWSGRGRDSVIKCEFCGSNVPKHKAVEVRIGSRFSSDVYEVAEYVATQSAKAYACISCAKHRKLVKDGIHTTEKEKRQRKQARKKKEMDKVMAKVKEIERIEAGKEKKSVSEKKEGAGKERKD